MASRVYLSLFLCPCECTSNAHNMTSAGLCLWCAFEWSVSLSLGMSTDSLIYAFVFGTESGHAQEHNHVSSSDGFNTSDTDPAIVQTSSSLGRSAAQESHAGMLLCACWCVCSYHLSHQVPGLVRQAHAEPNSVVVSSWLCMQCNSSWPAKKLSTRLLAVQATQCSYLDSFSPHNSVSQDAAQGLGTMHSHDSDNTHSTGKPCMCMLHVA